MNDAKVRAYFEVLGLDIHDATWRKQNIPQNIPKLTGKAPRNRCFQK